MQALQHLLGGFVESRPSAAFNAPIVGQGPAGQLSQPSSDSESGAVAAGPKTPLSVFSRHSRQGADAIIDNEARQMDKQGSIGTLNYGEVNPGVVPQPSGSTTVPKM